MAAAHSCHRGVPPHRAASLPAFFRAHALCVIFVFLSLSDRDDFCESDAARRPLFARAPLSLAPAQFGGSDVRCVSPGLPGFGALCSVLVVPTNAAKRDGFSRHTDSKALASAPIPPRSRRPAGRSWAVRLYEPPLPPNFMCCPLPVRSHCSRPTTPWGACTRPYHACVPSPRRLGAR